MTGIKNEDQVKLIDWANRFGYTVRKHTHPKTKANW